MLNKLKNKKIAFLSGFIICFVSVILMAQQTRVLRSPDIKGAVTYYSDVTFDFLGNALLPKTDSEESIGSSIYKYANGYFDNITLGDSTTGDVDATMYFSDDASLTAESFKWDDGNSRFQLSDDLHITADGAAAITLSGSCGNGIDASGTYSDHVIDIQPAATLGDYKAFYVGTWGTEAQFNDGGGLFRIYGKVGSGGTASANIFVRTLTESTSPPIGMQIYTDTDAATPGAAGMSAADFFTVLNAGAYLATSSGSWLNSMHSVWAKVQGDVTSVCNGSVAPLWVDNQMSCAVAEEEFGVIMTTGGSRPDGAFGFETTSSGYDQLFYFDATFNSGAGTCVTTDAVPGGNQDARIKVYYNGTQYYIPLYR